MKVAIGIIIGIVVVAIATIVAIKIDDYDDKVLMKVFRL